MALLKSAYLAACAILGTVPEHGVAASVRSELTAALGADRKAPLRPGPLESSLRVYRTYRPAKPGEVWLVVDESNGDTRFLISLADVLVVEWPLESWRIITNGQAIGMQWSSDESP